MQQTDPSSESITEQAAAWQIRLTSGQVSDEDTKCFAEWLGAHPDHAAAYRQMQTLWQQMPTPVLADRRRRRAWSARAARRARLLNFGKFAAAASVLLMLGGRLFPDYLDYPLADYRTRIGEQRSVVLGDGSLVHLNTNTAIDVVINGNERRITFLRGEAEFQVAHDASRPFRVSSGTTTTEALGTRFIVRYDSQAGAVTLLQGKVRSSRPSKRGAEVDSATLHPGQQLVFNAEIFGAPQPVELGDVGAWRRGRLLMNFVPLRQVIAEINRYQRRQIRLLDDTLGEREVNIAVDIQQIDAWLQALQRTLQLKVVEAGPFVFLQS